MARLTPYQAAVLEGVRAAQREHQRLGTQLTSRVEIFDVIEDERIWLLFRRLGNLYGMYKRYGDAPGIMINAEHPLSLQRYTAAHEYGHHVLGHSASADEEERIERWPRDPREVAVQAFAGEFLMPLQLVNYTLRTMGLPGKDLPLTALQVYQLALDLGVSYRAAVTQLKTHLRGPGSVLRSKSPDMVRQEIYGYLLTHYAISALICQAATEAGIDPDRVKFLRTARIIRRRAADPAFPPDQARRSLAAVMTDITSPRNLNPRRRHRSYPRVIRRARHNSYRVKRPGDTGTRYHGPPTIKLVSLRPQRTMINLR